MREHRTTPRRLRLLGAALLFGAVGGAAFLSWRARAPLARSYRRAKRRREDRARGVETAGDADPDVDLEPPFDPGPNRGGGSDAGREPGTDPA